MKSINFTAIEILPALLSKKKVQMIEPAWKEKYVGCDCKTNFGFPCRVCDNSYIERTHKSARFKVGDQVELYWMQRSKDDWFCKQCGNAHDLIKSDREIGTSIEPYCMTCKDYVWDFNKLLGTAEITEVFKIEMNNESAHTAVGGHDGYDTFYLMPGYKLYEKTIKEFAKASGFPSAKEMFAYFDKKYDLTNPKQFWVYRWKWLK